MLYNIAFYVHHHGSGHLMRSLAIARKLSGCKISFLGSNLAPYDSILPEYIQCVDLPMDTAIATDLHYKERPVAALHYAPLNIEGQLSRINVITNFFQAQPNTLFVVDVSVEIAMLATLLGIPTIVVRQHGKRDDPAHQIAYQNAIGLLAPYSEHMHPEEEQWLREKTFFSGGFSRYKSIFPSKDQSLVRHIAVLIGSGGTSIDTNFLNHLAVHCPEWHINVVGKLEDASKLHSAPNLSYHGHQEDPSILLKQANVIIGNAGHNTVMEVASLNKPFIVIPENRPFDEQLVKAEILGKLGAAQVVQTNDLLNLKWSKILEEALRRPKNWDNTIDPKALDKTAAHIKQKYNEIFQDF